MGGNCGHAPEELLAILPEMRQAAPQAYLVAKPNAGVPKMVKRQVVYDASPESMASLAQRFVEAGVQIVGACCGSSPAHVAAICLAVGCDAETPAAPAKRARPAFVSRPVGVRALPSRLTAAQDAAQRHMVLVAMGRHEGGF